jgi:hypothetical protein
MARSTTTCVDKIVHLVRKTPTKPIAVAETMDKIIHPSLTAAGRRNWCSGGRAASTRGRKCTRATSCAAPSPGRAKAKGAEGELLLAGRSRPRQKRGRPSKKGGCRREAVIENQKRKVRFGSPTRAVTSRAPSASARSTSRWRGRHSRRWRAHRRGNRQGPEGKSSGTGAFKKRSYRAG